MPILRSSRYLPRMLPGVGSSGSRSAANRSPVGSCMRGAARCTKISAGKSGDSFEVAKIGPRSRLRTLVAIAALRDPQPDQRAEDAAKIGLERGRQAEEARRPVLAPEVTIDEPPHRGLQG